ncbi:hypothetical protein BV25DRAFT_1843248 [Artomyces pyxidatus]|uniref:Uncharacterized protein n=1 Tax=Artomyces pyxidatus TaxID=48021 RepID=A0ACB8SFP1_9AGAM|nr:hypothetical protein BV25DRAFT_1843248 [Artomyces pyxidatus]
MNTPRLVPGDDPGCFIVYLTRPGVFDFTLVPPGGVYHGLLRIAIRNVAAVVEAEERVQGASDSSQTAAPYNLSSQTSSPVETSQPDWDLPIPIPVSRSMRPRSQSEPSTVAVPAIGEPIPVEQPVASTHGSRSRAGGGRIATSRSPSPSSVTDAGSESSVLSLLVEALMEHIPDRAHLEAAIFNERSRRFRNASVQATSFD